MDWRKLLQLIPVAAEIANPQLEAAAQTIVDAVNSHLTEQSAQTGKSVDELIAEAGDKWSADVQAADDLAREGH
jgi:hypothetical protein